MCAVQVFYVLVDYHAYPGDATVSSGDLVSDWQTLWTAITSLSDFKSTLAGRVFLDLINEPDGINVQQAPIATFALHIYLSRLCCKPSLLT